MPFPRYSPPLERIREEYSRMVRTRLMARKRPARNAGLRPIPDNSTPWHDDPRTVSDLLEIGHSVQRFVDEWGPKSR